MALNNLGIGFVFTARDLASARMRGLQRSFNSLDRSSQISGARIDAAFRTAATGIAVFAAGAATLAGGLALANAAGQFEQNMASVRAVTRATESEFEALRQTAIQAGIDTQFSPAEAVEGLQSLATAGQTARQATETLNPVLQLAAGSLGQLGVAGAAEAVVGTLNAYGASASEASSITDRLLRTTQLTNFQARDFEVGLSKAAAAGATFNQDLNDVLLTMGLLRNRNIDASSSSTAFREAVRRLGSDQRAQQAITSQGVAVFDEQTQQMRSVVDIMQDFSDATSDLSDAERNRRVVTAFGARGLLAFNAIQNASITTTENGVETTLRGADAIRHLRVELAGAGQDAAQLRELGVSDEQIAQFQDATRVAEEFQNQLLDTFEGQKTLLAGTLQTFAIVLGEPFAKVFKPIVAAVTNALNFLIRAFQALPEPVRRAFAGFVVAVGAILSLVGGAIAAKAAFVLLVAGLKAIGITLGGLIATMLPAILILGVLSLAVAGFVVAVRRDVGGIGTSFRRTFERVKLFVRAMGQLFSDGAFSGAVLEELNRAENSGIKAFAVRVFVILSRIRNFFSALIDSFGTAIEAAAPTFERLVAAFRRVGEALGLVTTPVDTSANAAAFDAYGQAGARVGEVLATVAEILVGFFTAAVEAAAGVIEGFKSVWEFLEPAIDAAGESLMAIGEPLQGLISDLSGAQGEMDSTKSLWEALGAAFGIVATIIAGAVRVVANVIRGVAELVRGFVGLFSGLIDIVVGLLTGDWERAWRGAKQLVFSVVNGIVGAVLALAGAVGSAIDSIAGLFGEDTGFEESIREARREFEQDLRGTFGLEEEGSSEPAAPSRSPAVLQSLDPSSLQSIAPTSSPAVSEAGARASSTEALISALRENGRSQERALAEISSRPINNTIAVDGDALFSAVSAARRESSARSFSAVGG